MHQTIIVISVRIKPSDNNMHTNDHMFFCALKKVSVSIGSWHQDVMDKRTLWGVWMVNGRKFHIDESDH